MKDYKSHIIPTSLSLLITAASTWKSVLIFSNFNLLGNLILITLSFLIIYLFIYSLTKALQQIRQRNFRKGIIKVLTSFLFAVIIMYFFTIFSVSLPAFTGNHFRTNILTGNCNYGGTANKVVHDPWYYKPDCKSDKKIETAKEQGFYQTRIEECSRYCTNKEKDYYCDVISVGNAWGNGPENLKCYEIATCPNLDCTEYKRLK